MHAIQLRSERPEDHRAVEELTREAFWNHYVPGCTEHYLAHILRTSEAFVQELDTVAFCGDVIAGNIMYTRGKILGDNTSEFPVLCFGPLAVLPIFQRKGVGKALIEYTKGKAARMGHKAILIYGDPAYYQRFGFLPAEAFGIGTSDDHYADALQVLELQPEAMSGHTGRFFEDPIYNVDSEAALAFDKGFPSKEYREGTPSQARFRELLQRRRPRRN